MKWLVLLTMAAFFALMLWATTSLPGRGDPAAPASVYVSPDYIERTMEETDTPNIVTSVLADYRGYDTLGETTVIFTAGMACIIALMHKRQK